MAPWWMPNEPTAERIGVFSALCLSVLLGAAVGLYAMYRLQKWLKRGRDAVLEEPNTAADLKCGDASYICKPGAASIAPCCRNSQPPAAATAAGLAPWPSLKHGGPYNVAAGAGVLPMLDTAANSIGAARHPLPAAPTRTAGAQGKGSPSGSSSSGSDAATATASPASSSPSPPRDDDDNDYPQEPLSPHGSRHDSSRSFTAGDGFPGPDGPGKAVRRVLETGPEPADGDGDGRGGDCSDSSRYVAMNSVGTGLAVALAGGPGATAGPGSREFGIPSSARVRPVAAAANEGGGVAAPTTTPVPVTPPARTHAHIVTPQTPSCAAATPAESAVYATRALFESYHEREIEQRLLQAVFGPCHQPEMPPTQQQQQQQQQQQNWGYDTRGGLCAHAAAQLQPSPAMTMLPVPTPLTAAASMPPPATTPIDGSRQCADLAIATACLSAPTPVPPPRQQEQELTATATLASWRPSLADPQGQGAPSAPELLPPASVRQQSREDKKGADAGPVSEPCLAIASAPTPSPSRDPSREAVRETPAQLPPAADFLLHPPAPAPSLPSSSPWSPTFPGGQSGAAARSNAEDTVAAVAATVTGSRMAGAAGGAGASTTVAAASSSTIPNHSTASIASVDGSRSRSPGGSGGGAGGTPAYGTVAAVLACLAGENAAQQQPPPPPQQQQEQLGPFISQLPPPFMPPNPYHYQQHDRLNHPDHHHHHHHHQHEQEKQQQQLFEPGTQFLHLQIPKASILPMPQQPPQLSTTAEQYGSSATADHSIQPARPTAAGPGGLPGSDPPLGVGVSGPRMGGGRGSGDGAVDGRAEGCGTDGCSWHDAHALASAADFAEGRGERLWGLRRSHSSSRGMSTRWARNPGMAATAAAIGTAGMAVSPRGPSGSLSSGDGGGGGGGGHTGDDGSVEAVGFLPRRGPAQLEVCGQDAMGVCGKVNVDSGVGADAVLCRKAQVVATRGLLVPLVPMAPRVWPASGAAGVEGPLARSVAERLMTSNPLFRRMEGDCGTPEDSGAEDE
ncbi:hypothetical protein VOLCADRAFT_89154 [Volvox carteri f. nagariensis]|uniref:Uncharacterized protein n=1 Tax=Volvox carteri f. nagariensis TaxID=3068 RepID=D8TQY0_VOLCA|nr:uncharacterized protein VOLCADRAFT_89154 [Volvox carteri f. nagariensis]EFJ50238.1 hypothetical protein VOLCADRAFT_89154 [Volvox carteri f. nagariensis]|eukprot:XP_002948858.1 hypothetical protein VOLCADRAFT_89154 [Volvox carteri f. nagariensis]